MMELILVCIFSQKWNSHRYFQVFWLFSTYTSQLLLLYWRRELIFADFANLKKIYQNLFWQHVNNQMIINNISKWFTFDLEQNFHQILWGLFCEWPKNKRQKMQNFQGIKLHSFNTDFGLIHFRPVLSTYSPWKYSYIFREYRKNISA